MDEGQRRVLLLVLEAMRNAKQARMRPCGFELGPKEWEDARANVIFGLRAELAAESGVVVLALPSRRIGRYEVVCPERFPA